MNTLSKSLIFTLLLIFTWSLAGAQKAAGPGIEWHDFEEAMKLNEKKPKKIFIDMYTEWCGWCKKMDQSTFIDPVIVDYMNKNYYAVKFDAETPDTIFFKSKPYINQNPEGRRSSHDLARTLLNGRMSYPSFVFLHSTGKVITIVPGFRKPEEMEPILHFIAEEAYEKDSWEEYSTGFEGSY